MPQVRKPNLHSDRGQDSNPCAWRLLRPQSTHGSTVPRRSHYVSLGYWEVESLHIQRNTIPLTATERGLAVLKPIIPVASLH
ncbi:hypothetical protein E2C01_049307 [Portunus trituberculatus]|uniref:Uncharacterized protein n=1 Tax=Portunus trituberculatus TaxID=210409 RepID=A0A5B7GFQ2_PORTR|nr:hypothetical protein [Portunus trituberculatus]